MMDPWVERPMKALATAFLLLLLLPGCVQQHAPVSTPSSTEAPQQSHIAIEPPKAGMADAMGAIEGRVQRTDGSPLPDVVVGLVSHRNEASTGPEGEFRFDGLAAGPYLLQAGREGYRTAATRLEVQAGATTTVTVTLVIDSAAPVPVDFWHGRESTVVVDAAFGNDRPDLQASSGGCLPSAQRRNGGSPTIRFDEPHQLVWPGTARVEVRLDWGDASYRGDTLAVVWRETPETAYRVSEAIPRGGTHAIEVAPEAADRPRQRFSQWEFGVCTQAAGESTGFGRVLTGSIHVTMALVRGHPLPNQQPEADFWGNTTRHPLVNETRRFDASQDPTLLLTLYNPAHHPGDGLIEDQGHDRFVPAKGLLVPPGATALHARLAWAYGAATAAPPLSLSYASANVAPWQRGQLGLRGVPEPVEKGDGYRVYHIPLAAQDLDGADDPVSAWAFYWTQEGDERSQQATPPCCDLEVRLVVEAVRAPA
jgi:hypothetical protein